jgi:hypothetical protein
VVGAAAATALILSATKDDAEGSAPTTATAETAEVPVV